MSIRSYREVRPPKIADTPTMAIWKCLDWLENNASDGVYNAIGDGGSGTIEVSVEDLKLLAKALWKGEVTDYAGDQFEPEDVKEFIAELEEDIKAVGNDTHVTYHCY